jgi:hypothetical protein
MKRYRIIPPISLVLSAALLSSPAVAQEVLEPGQVRVQDISYRGSGCSRNSVSWTIAADGQAISVLFSEFVVEDGPGAPAPDRRKDCRIVVDLRYPADWQYTIHRVDYRGGAYLDAGSWGRQQARLHIRGAGAVPSHMRIDGPHSGNYVVTSRLEPNVRAWSLCRQTGTLTVDTSIHVQARQDRSALMTVDSVDGVVEQTYRLEWRRCR